MIYPRINFRFKYIILVFIVIIYSCSKNDEDNETPPISAEDMVPFDITVFAKKNDSIYQLDILGNPEEMEVINLSQTLNLPTQYRDDFINGSKITFFDNRNGSYAFWQKDVESGNVISRDPICEPMENDSWLFPRTSENQIGILTVQNSGVNDWKNYLNIFNSNTASCNRILISDFYIPQQNYTYLHKDRFYLYSRNANYSEHSLTIINTNSGEQIEKFTFESAFQTMMSNDELYLLFPDGSYKIYDLNGLSLQKEGNTSNQYLFNFPGIHKSEFKGSKMVFDYLYPQPSPLASAPAIYNWSTDEITHGGDFYMTDALRQLEDEKVEDFSYTTVKVNLDTNILAAGYKNVRNMEGGVLFFNFEGEILMNIPLDYVPYRLMIRD